MILGKGTTETHGTKPSTQAPDPGYMQMRKVID
jgi:hypothetical protein